MPRNEDLKELLEHRVLFPVLVSALVALTGWVYTTGNRVSAMEVRQGEQEKTIAQRLDSLATDVREIRDWIVPKAPPGGR